MINKFLWFLRYYQCFGSLRDVLTWRRLRKHPASGLPEVRLRIRKLGGIEQVCRPGTTDPAVLWNVLSRDYHLPPRPLPDNAVIIDLGANAGYTTSHLAQRYPTARVIGVEMDPDNAAMARKNTSMWYPRCQIVEAAIWGHDGELTYGVYDKQDRFRVLSNDSTSDIRRRNARAVCMETLLAEHSIGNVDFIKMDIEGAEDVVVRSESSWLRHVHAMRIEVHPPATISEIARRLTVIGFECCRFEKTGPPGLTAIRKS